MGQQAVGSRGCGQALCEWLNSRKDNGQYPTARDLLDTHVPVDLVTDIEVDSLLGAVQEGRRALRNTSRESCPTSSAAASGTSRGFGTRSGSPLMRQA